jgi:hypothetical protein
LTNYTSTAYSFARDEGRTLSATPWFEKVAVEAFGSELNFWDFQEWIVARPNLGTVIRGTGGARKIRWEQPNRGKGTRGGLRVIYFWFESHLVIVLVSVYSKDEKEDLTPQERCDLRDLSRRLRSEFKRRQNP